MEKVLLGNTGIYVSPICFGTLTVGPVQANLSLNDGSDVISYAIDLGINFFDTAQLYETYDYIKLGMEKANKYDIVISTKTYAYEREQAVRAVEEARTALNRDYIDIFMLHEQESIHTLNGHSDALDYLLKCKQKGIIKAVGCSTHRVAGVLGALEKRLDVVHPLINFNGLGIDDGTREDMENAIIKASNQGVGIFSMKALGGGNLHKNASECLNYIFDLKHIDSVAIGMQTTEEVTANINFYNNRCFSSEELVMLSDKKRKLHIDEWCIGCGECVRRCSQGALKIVDKKALCDNDLCILCGYCSRSCSEWAIKVV